MQLGFVATRPTRSPIDGRAGIPPRNKFEATDRAGFFFTSIVCDIFSDVNHCVHSLCAWTCSIIQFCKLRAETEINLRRSMSKVRAREERLLNDSDVFCSEAEDDPS